MERMKIEIEKSEYNRLKSREEKLMAYYEWFVDKENDLATVEDIVTENIKLKEEIKELYKLNESLYKNVKYFDHRLCDIDSKLISKQEENKKLEEENEKMRKHIKENGYIDDVAYIKKENAKLKEEMNKVKDLFNKRDMTGNDKFLEGLKDLLRD